jgi:hypothetical protein
MKLLPLASLTFVAPLLLTGCATSTSLDDQAKLIEYEQCLRFEPEMVNQMIEVQLNRSDTPLKESKRGAFEEYLKTVKFEEFLEDCAKYRP